MSGKPAVCLRAPLKDWSPGNELWRTRQPLVWKAFFLPRGIYARLS